LAPRQNPQGKVNYTVRTKGEYKYLDEGKGEVLMMLHGLFGALSNWEPTISALQGHYRVIVPVLPIYEMSILSASIDGLRKYVEGFVKSMGFTEFHLVGNSLGGHIAIAYTFEHPAHVKTLILTGSSGLFENSMGGSFPKRGSYDYIKERVGYTFYDPATASEDLIQEVFEITKSVSKCMAIVAIAKSAQRHNLANDLYKINVPTLLIWGLNDTITPPHVAHEFNRLIGNSELYFIDKCCHAPMMEQPEIFNNLLIQFLQRQ
jgi:pimeloyl-ACP methyl ester carboxylesterase